MRDSIAELITSTIEDLNKMGLVDEIIMKNIQSLCIPETDLWRNSAIFSPSRYSSGVIISFCAVFIVYLLYKWLGISLN